LINSNGFSLTITSNLPFWQIYTPPDGKRIAVEPMSFTGNLYKILELDPKELLKNGSFTILAKD
jgi:hypothetical protein